MTITDAPGAKVLLDLIKLRSSDRFLEEALEDDDDLEFRYSEYDWSGPDFEVVKVPGKFITSVNCSDAFFWGSGDSEDITEETWPILLQTIEDLRPVYAEAEHLDEEARKRSQIADHESYEKYKADHPDDDPEWWNGYNPTQYVPAHRQPEHQAECWTGRRQTVGRALCELFVARVRGQRPQGASYSYYPKATWPMFDAAGPERETGIGNPCKPGEYQGGPRW